MPHSITNRIPAHLFNPKVHYRVHLCLSWARRTQTTPCLSIYLISISIWSICAHVLKVFSFLQPIKSSPPPDVKHAPPISSPVNPSAKYLTRSTKLAPPDYAIFSRLLLLPPYQAQASPQHLILDPPQDDVLPSIWDTKFRTHTKQQKHFLWEIISVWLRTTENW